MNKIYDLDKLAKLISWYKTNGRKVVLCHGCFDLVHVGHIRYFKAAKQMGDILVVTLTQDIYVNKGPNRPVFNQDLRAESIASLECVDYVAINKWQSSEETIRLLKPNIYVKGQEYEGLKDKTGNIVKEANAVKDVGGEIRFTHETVFSSTKLLKEFELVS